MTTEAPTLSALEVLANRATIAGRARELNGMETAEGNEHLDATVDALIDGAAAGMLDDHADELTDLIVGVGCKWFNMALIDRGYALHPDAIDPIVDAVIAAVRR